MPSRREDEHTPDPTKSGKGPQRAVGKQADVCFPVHCLTISHFVVQKLEGTRVVRRNCVVRYPNYVIPAVRGITDGPGWRLRLRWGGKGGTLENIN
jgi:hypothetical protein